ncbi:unnamed protein product, partial [Rotaria magnacalcarata]
VENEIIEDALNANKVEVEIDGGYLINIKYQVQYTKYDHKKQHSIKRRQLSKDSSAARLREERFAVPMSLATNTVFHAETQSVDELDRVRCWGDISRIYDCVENPCPRKKTVRHIVDEAVQGMIKEGAALNKEHEAQWLAQQLGSVKHYAENGTNVENLPAEIGDTLIHIYTRDSFWFKRINGVLREIEAITSEQLKDLGPFCYLLHQYLQCKKTLLDCFIVYRGLLLTDEQRQDFMKEKITFTSFTSTSRNRDLAEIYGNTLLIIDLNPNLENLSDTTGRRCGIDITHVSQFTEEEEFLIWPNRNFDFVKYEYDRPNKKHIIYLHKSRHNW